MAKYPGSLTVGDGNFLSNIVFRSRGTRTCGGEAPSRQSDREGAAGNQRGPMRNWGATPTIIAIANLTILYLLLYVYRVRFAKLRSSSYLR